MWQKYVTRRLAVQVAQAWNFGWGEAMKRVYGVSLTKTLVFRDNKKTDYYVDKKQHTDYVKGLYALLKKEKFLKIFHLEAQRKLREYLHGAQEKLLVDFSRVSNKKLLDLYQSFVLPTSEQFYVRMWMIFNIGTPLVEVVRRELEKKLTNKKLVQRYLLNLSSPLELNDVLKQRRDLLKIAVEKKVGKLDAHTKLYEHIPMFDFDHDPYIISHFKKELKLINNPQKELTDLNNRFKKKQLLFKQTLKELKPDKYQKLLFKFLKENVYLRDYRDMLRQKYNICLKSFYLEVGRRMGLKIDEIATLTNKEIRKYLDINKRFSKKEAARRAKAYLLIQDQDKIRFFSGREASRRARDLLENKFRGINSELKGIVGSSGMAQGKVRIVYTNKDLYKVRSGDILVATMTRQDFVPAMRRAFAIVTDEGGITCHAAIMARELKIPCIVGTKYATKILKDGIRVKVDANQGVITKI